MRSRLCLAVSLTWLAATAVAAAQPPPPTRMCCPACPEGFLRNAGQWAFASASQAESAGGGHVQSIGAAPRLMPIFSLAPGPDGAVTGRVGVGGLL